MNLEGVDIFQAETIRTAAKIPTELRYRTEVRLLRRRRQIADRHVLDHAAAKRADLSHRKSVLLASTRHGQTFRLPSRITTALAGSASILPVCTRKAPTTW